MLKPLLRLTVLLLSISIAACSAPQSNASIKAGKDYQVVPSTLGVNAPPSDKIKVIEFFSYGCPWCFRLEPDLEKWLVSKGKNIEFERIPVVFEPGWDVLAKAYYTAKNLGVDQKIMRPFFVALQTQGEDLSTADDLQAFFVSQGVSAADFQSAYNFSPGIDAQMMQGDKLMRQYGVYSVPSFVVDGRFVTNMAMVDGNTKRLLEVVDYLIDKAKRGE